MRARRSATAQRAPVRWQAYAAAAVLLMALLFGGGGAEGPINNGLIAAASATVLLLLVASYYRGRWPLAPAASAAAWLLAALLAIVTLQLVPLPLALWDGLPGREIAKAALGLTPQTAEWRPLSLDPEATRRFAASLLLPAALVFGMLGATRREALVMVRAVVAAAGLSAVIGALQLVLGARSWLTYYDGLTPGAASGVFANPNHQASLLLVGMIGLALLIRTEKPHVDGRRLGLKQGFHFGLLALPFFIVMTIATGSRGGIALLLLAAPGALLIALGRRSPVLWLAAFGGVVGLLALMVMFNPTSGALAAGQNLLFGQDKRYAFLPDVLFTLREFWPWGSGLGSFVSVLAINENLDIAGGGFINHAHNDLLEWLIETGVFGALWLAAATGLLGWSAVRTLRKRGPGREAQIAAVLTGSFMLVLLALHSLLDYPLRTGALAAVAGLAVGLVVGPFRDVPAVAVQPRSATARWPLILAVVAGLLIGAQTVRMGIAQAAVREGNGGLAFAVRPQNGFGVAQAAEAQLAAGNTAAAVQLAAAAIDRAPLAARAVRVLAMATMPGSGQSAAAWRVASAMGWRDAPTQLWAMQQALAGEEHETAAIRADALLRTNVDRRADYLGYVRASAIDPHFRAELIRRLALGPAWRRSFFSLAPAVPVNQLQGVHAVLRQLAGSELSPTRAEARAVIAALIRRKQYASAVALYRTLFGTAAEPAGNVIDDGGFDRSVSEYLDATTAFDWTFGNGRGVTATIEGEPRALLIESDGGTAYRPVRRYVALTPGRYAMQYLMRGDADAPEALGIAVYCVGDPRPIATSPTAPLSGARFQARQFTFDVAENCPLIFVAFEAKAIGRPSQAEFDGIALRRL